jgi:uncharacterized membrane protein
MSAIAYTIMMWTLIHQHGKDWVLTGAIGKDFKGKLSLLLYGIAIWIAFREPMISCALYATVAVIWFVPDSRIEKIFSTKSGA